MNDIIDGRHITDVKTSFEWWYFDFDLISGDHLYIEWQAPVFNMRDNYSMFVLRYISPIVDITGKSRRCEYVNVMKILRYDNSCVSSETGRCCIKFPEGFIEEKNGNYYINVKHKEFFLDISLTRLCPSVAFRDNDVLFDFNSGGFFAWNIPLCRAAVTGIAEIDGKRLTVTGTGYHDHNYGNINIQKCLSGWLWARIHFDEFSVVLGDISLKNLNGKKILMLVGNDGKKFAYDNVEFQYSYGMGKIPGNNKLPDIITINLRQGEICQFVIKINTVFSVQEAPLGKFNSHRLNTLYSKIFYLFRFNLFPVSIKNYMGRLLYYQAEAFCEMSDSSGYKHSSSGKVEVFNFDV